ncbi:short chain dehydrogenase [Rhizoctonia solani]|uniref:Short chain dehydrogenase n=1 Tax=Rhizoctonia solani TaxID=456999 RepID=A0A8H8NYE8_9AGAM|nr:short chain dehydrogenase [Rhizoctonia solani]QRW20955.1 short chain dehydrogenase [Rhizoctonia solani]
MSKSTELLKSKKMIIVGGSSGLGRSLAAAVLAHGASVVIASSSQEKVNAALEKLKQEVPPAPNATITGQAVDLKDFTALKEFLRMKGRSIIL